tara:strand:+ start:522 stop:1256 length:735 start_codon:yes stop_codon:yes gene_type:complete
VLAESNFSPSNRLVDNGVIYEFFTIPVYDDNKEFMYNTGKISVSRTNGETISMAKYNQSPGCGSDFPAIQIQEVPLAANVASPKQKKQKFIVFCGSNDGRHKTLRFYNPHFGFVSAVDFFDGPIDVRESESKINLIINHKDYFHSINKIVSYPLVYELRSNGLSIETSLDYSENSKSIYASVLEGNHKNDESTMIRKLIASAFSEDKAEYCDRFLNNPKRIAKLIKNEIEKKLHRFNTPNCEGK